MLPEVEIQGCSFHWTQPVWRKTHENGLAVAYRQDPGTREICRRLLALPLLPADEAQGTFARLSIRATTDHLEQFFRYVRTTWVDSVLWPPPNEVRLWQVDQDQQRRRGLAPAPQRTCQERPGQPLRPDRATTRGKEARLYPRAAGAGAKAQAAPAAPAANVPEVPDPTLLVVGRGRGRQPHSSPAAGRCLCEGPRTCKETVVVCVYYEIFCVTGVFVYMIQLHVFI